MHGARLECPEDLLDQALSAAASNFQPGLHHRLPAKAMGHPKGVLCPGLGNVGERDGCDRDVLLRPARSFGCSGILRCAQLAGPGPRPGTKVLCRLRPALAAPSPATEPSFGLAGASIWTRAEGFNRLREALRAALRG